MEYKINIPIYRAKKIDSDEFIEGYYIYSEYENKHFIAQDLTKSTNHEFTGGYSLAHWFEIDTTTLSIHFPDMLDSEGNKIFASLQEDGKGGDVVKFVRHGYPDQDTTSLFHNGCVVFEDIGFITGFSYTSRHIIGIKNV